MPHYMLQVAYTPEAWANQIKNPQNRLAAIRPVVEKLCFDVHAGDLYGLPFAEIFARFGRNWFAVPDLLDSPARVVITMLVTELAPRRCR